MILEFTYLADVNSGKENIVIVRKSRGECATDAERSLWDMHVNHPDRVWTTGKIIAERLDDQLIQKKRDEGEEMEPTLER